MKHITHKIVAGFILAGSVMVLPSTAFAATVSDQAGFFDDASALKSELASLEQERGLDVIVETVPENSDSVDVSLLADELRGNNEDAVAVVMEAGTNKIGVSYGGRITYAINSDTLEKIVDKEMIPLLQEGEYDESIIQMMKSINFLLGVEDETDAPSAPGINGWFADNKAPLAVAVASFMLFFAFSFFFLTKRSGKKKEELADALSIEKARRLKEVKAFWDFTDDSVKERFVKAANKDERESVMSEVFMNQTFVETNAQLTNLVGSFIYPGKVEKNYSIQYFMEYEDRAAKNQAEALKMWESLTADQKAAMNSASSESHQEALVAKFFPDHNPVELVARFNVMVPQSRSKDPNFSNYVEEKLAEAEAKDAATKKPGLFNFFGK